MASKRKGKVLAKVRAKVTLGEKSKEVVMSRDVQNRLKILMDKGSPISKKRMLEIAEQVGVRLKRVELVMVDSPPPSKTLELPVRKGKGVGKLDTALAREICKHLERGAQLVLVCSWVGITPSQFGEWLKKSGEPYETFQQAVRKALAFAEMKMMVMIEMGSYNDPHAAMKWMAMRYPNKYQLNPQMPAGVNLTFDLGSFLSQSYDRNKEAFEKKRARVLAEPKVIEGEVVQEAPAAEAAKGI